MKTLGVKIIYIVLVSLVAGLLTGCRNMPINGDIDGQWQVMDVYPAPQEEIIKERLYYCFSLHICQLSAYDLGVWRSGKLIYDKEFLYLDFPDSNSPEAAATLKQFGIYNNPVKFQVEYLDKNKLILKDGDVTVSLRKF